MRCNNCGNEIPNGSFQCPVCGNKVNPQEQSQGQNGGFSQPNNGGFGGPQGQNFGGYQGNPGYNQWGGNMQRQGSAPEFVMFLIIGIVYTVCCCNILVAIPGLIFTFLMNSRYKEGNMVAYASNKNIAKWIYIIGVILWVLGIVIGILTGIIDIVTFSTSMY